MNMKICNFKILLSLFIIFSIYFCLPSKVLALDGCNFSTDPPTRKPIELDVNLGDPFGHIDSLTYNFNLTDNKEEFRKIISTKPLGGKLYLNFINRMLGHRAIDGSEINNMDSDFNKVTDKGFFLRLDYDDRNIRSMFNIPLTANKDDTDTHKVQVLYGYKEGGSLQYEPVCEIYQYQILRRQLKASDCGDIHLNYTGMGDTDSDWSIESPNFYLSKSFWVSSIIRSILFSEGKKFEQLIPLDQLKRLIGETQSIKIDLGRLSASSEGDKKRIEIWQTLRGSGNLSNDKLICELNFIVMPRGTPQPPTPTPTPPDPVYCKASCNTDLDCKNSEECNNDSRCKNRTEIDCTRCSFCRKILPKLSLCEQISEPYQSLCKDCDNRGGSIWTAIGCLPTDFSALLKDYVFTYGIGIAGGIAFLSFLYGVFLILTSAGNAEQIQQAKQVIVSALSGLLLIIFSVFLLKVIGVDILKLPDFGPK